MNKFIKDAIFGAIGGLAGTFVIGKVMGAAAKLQPKEDLEIEKRLIPEQPTEKLAGQIAADGLGIPIDDETKTTMGEVIRWGYGIGWGAMYGVLRNQYPGVAKFAGLPFGVGLSLLGWTALLPLFNLSPPPHKLPVSTHVNGLVSHYAYAATVEGVCELCEVVDRQVLETPQRTSRELRRVS